MSTVRREKMKRIRNYTLSLALISFMNGFVTDSYSSSKSSYALDSLLLVATGVVMIVIDNTKD